MFKIDLHALWSLDFVVPLIRVLAEILDIDPAQAKEMVDKVADGKPQAIFLDSYYKTTLLSQDILQYGLYTTVTQVEKFTEEQFAKEIIELMNPDLGGWMILLDKKEEHVLKIIDPQGLGMLRFESQFLMDEIGEEILQRGAAPIGPAKYDFIKARNNHWREEWAERIRAAIRRKIAERRAAEESEAAPSRQEEE